MNTSAVAVPPSFAARWSRRLACTAETKFQILLGVFAGAWGIMPSLTPLLIPLDLSWLGLGMLAFSYGAFMHAITYPCIETVIEVWGGARARVMVFVGVCVYLTAIAFLDLGTRLPASGESAQHLAFGSLYGSVGRMVLASLMATITAQLLDIVVFQKIKARTGRRGLWLRNSVSVLTSQVADTAIFYTVAFYGIIPNSVLPYLVLGTIVVKAVLAALGTPVVYLLVRWITGEWTATGDLGRKSAPVEPTLAVPAAESVSRR